MVWRVPQGLFRLRFDGPRPARTRAEHRWTRRSRHPIQKADLRAGDLLINPAPNLAGHVVIFDHWADATMASYVGYEQSGNGGTHHRTIPYPYFGGYQMSPYQLPVGAP